MGRMRRRVGAFVVAGVVGCALLVGCTPPPSGPPVVVLFPGSSESTWGTSAEVLRAELAGDGYDVEVRHAGDDIPAQLRQLREALAAAPTAIVIAPVDVTAIAAELAAIDDPEVAVVSYDRLVLDAPEVDYFATFDHRQAGRLQAGALLAGLGLVDPLADAGAGLAVELLAGSGDDPAAQEAFAGALEVLDPFVASGALVVPSGRVGLEQTAVLRGSPATAAKRIAELLADGVELRAVLSPTDAMSAAVGEVLVEAGLRVASGPPADEPEGSADAGATPGATPDTEATPDAEPSAAPDAEATPHAEAPVVLTGGGSTLAGARAVAAGEQSSTVFEDPRELARAVARMVREVVRGGAPRITQGATTDNGAREVPTFLLEPQLVTRADAEALLAG